MSFSNGPKGIVTDGIVFFADAGNSQCWTAGSDKAYNLVSPSTGSVVNDISGSLGSNGSWIFDGSDYITTPFDPDIVPNTLSAWVYPTAIDSYRCIINNDNGGYDMGMGIWPGEYWEVRFGNNGSKTAITSYRPSVDTWYHTCVVYSASDIEFYLNGERIYNRGSGPSGQSGPNATIGSKLGTSQFWEGNITGVITYDRALTTAEVLQNYNSQKARFGL